MSRKPTHNIFCLFIVESRNNYINKRISVIEKEIVQLDILNEANSLYENFYKRRDTTETKDMQKKKKLKTSSTKLVFIRGLS